jgi:uncharacterized membrane protein YphA (DoxX/SURF4 family)
VEKKISKEKIWDYFVLTARFLLAATFINYGYSKLTGGQFGISEAEMAMKVKDLSLFKLSWYLFDQEPFKSFIGIFQILCGLLLLFHKTSIIGALLFLPIVATILIIDLTFMPKSLATNSTWRLGYYIILDLLILWHEKDKMKEIWNSIWQNFKPKFNVRNWTYIFVPFFAIALEIAGVIPKMLTELIFSPQETLESLVSLPKYIMEITRKIGS